MKEQFNAITPNLMVHSVDETVKFYEDVLGFKKVMSVPPEGGPFVWAMVVHGGTTLMFQDKANMLEEYPVLKDKDVGGGFTLFAEVEDIDTLYKQLKDKVTFVKPLGVTAYGMTEFAIKDCNGLVLTLAQRKS